MVLSCKWVNSLLRNRWSGPDRTIHHVEFMRVINNRWSGPHLTIHHVLFQYISKICDFSTFVEWKYRFYSIYKFSRIGREDSGLVAVPLPYKPGCYFFQKRKRKPDAVSNYTSIFWDEWDDIKRLNRVSRLNLWILPHTIN